MKMPSGSTVERAIKCQASVVLPQLDSYHESADKGTALHAFVREAFISGRDVALARCPSYYREAAATISLDRIPGTQAHFEASYAYDLATGNARLVGYNLDRNYGRLGDTEMGLTLDMVWSTQDHHHVHDLKTGYKDVTPAYYNWQLRVAALAVTATHGELPVKAGIVYSRDGFITSDVAEYSLLDLAQFKAELKEAYGAWKALDGKPATELPYMIGKHCDYCPAIGSCYAKTGAVGKALALAGEVHLALTPENAPDYYKRYRDLKLLVDKMEGVFKAFASQNPIQLGDGVVYGKAEAGGQRTIDGAKALTVLTEMFGEEQARALVKTTHEVTQTRIKAALGADGLRNVMAKLQEAGAVGYTHFQPQVKEHAPRKKGD